MILVLTETINTILTKSPIVLFPIKELPVLTPPYPSFLFPSKADSDLSPAQLGKDRKGKGRADLFYS